MAQITITEETARHVLFHYGRPGGWRPGRYTELLMQAIDAADITHKAKLHTAYPELVEAMYLAAFTNDGTTRLQQLVGVTPTTTN